jgi:hypothetical protein
LVSSIVCWRFDYTHVIQPPFHIYSSKAKIGCNGPLPLLYISISHWQISQDWHNSATFHWTIGHQYPFVNIFLIVVLIP